MGFNDCHYSYELNDQNGAYYWRKTLNGKLTFVKEDFQYLMSIENANNRCTPLQLEIKKVCSGEIEYLGVIRLVDFEFDLSRCTITGEIPPFDEYTCMVNNGDNDVNIISGTAKSTIYFVLGDLELHNRAFSIVSLGTFPQKNNKRNPYYWGGNYNTIPDPGWMLYALTEGVTMSGFTVIGRSYWVREYIDLPVASTPPIGFILGSTDGITNHWVRQPVIIESEATNVAVADVNPPSGVAGTQYNWNYAGMSGNKTFNNAMELSSVLFTMLGYSACNNDIVSDFFQINPINTSNINYVTGQATKVNHLFLIQKSDAKHPDYITAATNGNYKFNDLAETLDSMFYVKHFIDENGKVRFEHISAFNKVVEIDLTVSKYAKYLQGKAKYSYDISKLPYQEDYKTEDAKSLDFVGKPIMYVDTCVSTRQTKLTHDCPQVSTDLEQVMSDDSVSDEGFVIVACAVYEGKYYIIQETPIFKNNILDTYEYHHNNSLAFAQLHRDYHKYYRALKHGVLNDEYQEFLSWRKTKKADAVAIPLCCEDQFNPEQLVKSIFGNGEVDNAEYKPKNEILEIELLHDVEEADIYSGTTYLKLVIENERGPIDLDTMPLYDSPMIADICIYSYADALGTIPKWINKDDFMALFQITETKHFVPTPGTPTDVPQTPIVENWNYKGYRLMVGTGRYLSADIVGYTGTAPTDWKTSTWAFAILPSPDYVVI